MRGARILIVAVILAPISYAAAKSQTNMAPPPSTAEMPMAHQDHPASVPSDDAQHGPVYSLETLEAEALQRNPTLAQANAQLHSAEGRKQQAGLWPNPTVGYFGDEISGGTGVNGGRQGGYIEQTIILGRKLYLAQQVAGSNVRLATLEKEEQRYRVQNAVRAAYIETLAAQEMLALEKSRAELSGKMLDTIQGLQNTGARDASEVLMAQIEFERANLAVDVRQAELRQQWEQLRSLVGDPSLPAGTLEGQLDAELPQLDTQQLIDALVSESPAVKMARESVRQAQTSVLRAQRAAVPNLQLRAGLEQNFETNDLTGKPYGLQGVAEARVELPIFSHNQGNVTVAKAELESSQAETQRLEMELRRGAAAVVEQYQTAQFTVERYRRTILPQTEKLYQMQQGAWQRMAVSYPEVLMAQQSLFSTQAEYIRALQNLRTNAVALSGFLLTDGTIAPGMAKSQ